MTTWETLIRPAGRPPAPSATTAMAKNSSPWPIDGLISPVRAATSTPAAPASAPQPT